MSAFLYFFPDHPHAIAKAADIPPACKLDTILDGAKLAYGLGRTAGPEGTSGFMIAVRPGDEAKAARCGYHPDEQRWAKVCADGKVTHWLGYEKATPPGPADLARPRMVPGDLVRLADGNEWVIPCIHVPLTTLPLVFRADQDGQSVLSVPERYEDICRLGATWFDRVARAEKLPYDEWLNFAAALLGLNYRLGLREILEIGLLDNSAAVFDGILGAALGFRAIELELRLQAESQKKTETDTPPVG